MTWAQGKKEPKTQQIHNFVAMGAFGGAFWGMLFWIIFFVPLLGMAIGATMGALTGSLKNVGINDEFIETDIGASYHWDAVFLDGDLYKSGRGGQCLYISPETDTVVVYFSASYRSTLWVHAYAREIVKKVFRKK